MPIPEDQLETWSHQGSITQSSNTYNAIKNVLEDEDVPYAHKDFEVFLQGSYGNDTNIYAESDVDIVIKLNDCWQSDLTELSDGEKQAYEKAYPNATYTHANFKNDVVQVLKAAYGDDSKPGDRAIAIAPRGSRRNADVIVAIQFRRYYKFNDLYDESFESGICFFDAAGDRIANYPKQHSANMTRKHKDSGQWLKPMVRILKNARSKLVADEVIKAGVAPSYYLEGLLYNVPSPKFKSSYQECLFNALSWLEKDANKDKLVCANEQYYLLWDDSHTSWPKKNYESFHKALVGLWNDW
jgi:hypothetical protein